MISAVVCVWVWVCVVGIDIIEENIFAKFPRRSDVVKSFYDVK